MLLKRRGIEDKGVICRNGKLEKQWKAQTSDNRRNASGNNQVGCSNKEV